MTTTPTGVIRYEPRSRVIDPHHEPIFAALVMELGYRRVGVIPAPAPEPEPEPVIVVRVVDPTTRPLGLALAVHRNRRSR